MHAVKKKKKKKKEKEEEEGKRRRSETRRRLSRQNVKKQGELDDHMMAAKFSPRPICLSTLCTHRFSFSFHRANPFLSLLMLCYLFLSPYLLPL